MCGICAYVSYDSTPENVLTEMVTSLGYRGPDDKGVFKFNLETTELGMGQTRLSVIDLSNMGHQPMHFEHLTIIFNGEIYNYINIRQELQTLGHHFVSDTDTEVILQAHAAWGLTAVHKFIGMFSYILFDKKVNKLFVFRDRAGVKPLYYYRTKQLVLFASELKAFHTHPAFIKDIDSGSMTLFFKLGYIPAPHSIFKNVYKLPAAHMLEYNIESNELTTSRYWDPATFYKKPALKIDYQEAREEVKWLLQSACEYRMIADVPVGIFLSGGYDSTAVTAILQKERTAKLKTFTIGFNSGLNEAPYARLIASHLGTDHSEVYCTPKDAEQIIKDLPYCFDEPFADISAIPTVLLSRLARKQVTVALSADGGDEVFGGYQHYESISKYLKQVDNIPGVFQKSSGLAAKWVSNVLSSGQVSLRHKLSGFSKTVTLSKNERVGALYEIMSNLPAQYVDQLIKSPDHDYKTSFSADFSLFTEANSIALAIDYENYLQNDILTKVDRATMSVSLEGREPLLDHRLIEFVSQLPAAFKNDGITRKKILKDIVHEYVPKSLLDRPKAGFDPPIYDWLRNELSHIVKHYLSKDVVVKSGLFNEGFITEIKNLFLSNKLHYSQLVWRIIIFQLWFERWM